jgi:CRISPR-associated endoribonuclease Cas6
MLISAVLTLQPTAPAAVPANLGRATHAWFLDQVRSLDGALADSLHAPNQERPFTVSNLWGVRAAPRDRDASPQTAQHDRDATNLRGARPAGDPSGFANPKGLAQVTLSPDRPCFLRLSSYQPALSSLIAERLLPALPETISLADATLRVAAATADPAQHPWAGRTTVQDLLLAHTLHGEPAPRATMRFASPTMFKSDNKYLPLPLPRLVFEGLARRWNAFAPVALPEEVTRFADECMVISRYRLRTERVAFGEGGEHGAFPGFVGSVTYSFRVKDRYWMGLIHLLAAFSLYAGVGQRVTMGLGQARRVEG